MVSISTQRRALCLLLVLTLSSIWGCKPGLPPQTEHAAARAGLAAALTAWKNNESVTALQQRQPPIFFTDFDQRAGKKLAAFSIDEDHRIYGRSTS